MLKTVLIGTTLLLCNSVAHADDWFAPDWRGDPLTIVAGWDYWGLGGFGPRSVMPGFYQANPDIFSQPRARAYFDSGVLVHDSLFGRSSVLEIGFDSNPATLAFGITNYTGTLHYRVQVTYYPGGGAPLDFGVGASVGDPPWIFNEFVAAVVTDAHMHPDGWRTAVYDLSFNPYSGSSGISIIFTEYPVYVDQVWIDTLAIPSPGAGSLLAVLGLMSVRRRR